MLATHQFNAINGLCGSSATPSAEDILEDIIIAKSPLATHERANNAKYKPEQHPP